ncbi:hypothetical protein GCM10028802_23370 [Terrabacter terrigena]
MKTVVRRTDAGLFDPVAGRVFVATEAPYPRRRAGSSAYPPVRPSVTISTVTRGLLLRAATGLSPFGG